MVLGPVKLYQSYKDTPMPLFNEKPCLGSTETYIHPRYLSYTKWKMMDQSDTISVSSRSQYSLFGQSRLQLIASLHGSDSLGSSRLYTRDNHSSRQYAPERAWHAVSSLQPQYEELTSGRSIIPHEHMVYLSRGAPRIVSCRARSRIS